MPIRRLASAGVMPRTDRWPRRAISRPVAFVAGLAIAAALTGRPLPAQAPAPKPARPADVASLDAILTALYDVISGPAGQQRDWDRFRSLFIPGARLIPTGGQPGQPARAVVLTPDEYITRAGASLETDGFFEREIGRVTESFGRITHAFSAYDSRRTPADPVPFARGVNSIQLLNDGTRWWVVSIYWDAERPDNPIPGRYLRRP